MARRRHIPSYQHHKASGQARVRIDGKDHYLGVYGSAESKAKYDDLISEMVISGEPAKTIALNAVLAAWWSECKRRYGKRGKGKYGHAICWRPVIRLLRETHGDAPAEDLGPANLRRTIERAAREKDWSLRYARDVLAKCKTILLWSKCEELVSSRVYDRIRDLTIRADSGLRQVQQKPPVDDDLVEKTLPHLSPLLRAMVRFQRLTGALVKLRGADIERNRGEVWEARLMEHKTRHLGKERIIYIGPRAQQVIATWLLKAGDEFVFTHSLGKTYTTDSYRRAIHRVCEREGIDFWSPQQIRKRAATEVREKFDVEHAASALGHSSSTVTGDHYATASRARAIEVARRLG